MTVFTLSSHISSATETAVPQPQLVKQARHFSVMDTAVTHTLCESVCTPEYHPSSMGILLMNPL